jgi:hypothetical protein
MPFNNPACPECGMEECDLDGRQDTEALMGKWVCLVCGHRFNAPIYLKPRHPSIEELNNRPITDKERANSAKSLDAYNRLKKKP